MDISIKELGAVGDGRVKNTEIIQRAIDMCAASGGRVLVSDGVYLTGRLTMRSNVELHIAAGATLLGSPDYADYPEAELTHVDTKMLPRERNACLILAECFIIALYWLAVHIICPNQLCEHSNHDGRHAKKCCNPKKLFSCQLFNFILVNGPQITHGHPPPRTGSGRILPDLHFGDHICP